MEGGTEQPGGASDQPQARGGGGPSPGAGLSLSKGVLLLSESENSWSCQANQYFFCGEKVNTNLLLFFQFVEQPMFAIWGIQNLWRDEHCCTLVRVQVLFYATEQRPPL